ncbi:MAG: O-antigen ligase family protein [Chloroflexota bacterium]
MEYSFQLLGQRFAFEPPRFLRSKLNLTLVLLAGGLAMAVVAAYLVVADQWYLALGMILALPGLILLHNQPLLGLAVWLLVTPFLMANDSGMMRKVYWAIHRGLPLLMLGIIVLASMLKVRKRPNLKLAWFEVAMIGYVLASIFSALALSPEPSATVINIYDRIMVPVLLYFIIRLLSPGEIDLQRLLPVLLFIALSQAFFGFAYIFARGILPSSWLRSDGERATGSMRAVAVYTTTLLFAGSVVLHAALSTRHKTSKRLFYIAIFAACLVAVFFSFSRASWLAGVAVMIGLFMIYPRFVTRFALLALPFLAVFAGVFLVDQLNYADDRLNSDQSALGRLPVVLASIEMFKSKPVLGWGYGNFDEYDRQFQGRVGDLVAPEKDHASHNVYLTILAEQGVVGLGLFLAPVVGLAILSVKKWSLLPAEGFWSRKLLLVFWLTIVAHIVVNNFSNMRIVFGLGIWWISLALIANLLFQTADDQPDVVKFEMLRRAR